MLWWLCELQRAAAALDPVTLLAHRAVVHCALHLEVEDLGGAHRHGVDVRPPEDGPPQDELLGRQALVLRHAPQLRLQVRELDVLVVVRERDEDSGGPALEGDLEP